MRHRILAIGLALALAFATGPGNTAPAFGTPSPQPPAPPPAQQPAQSPSQQPAQSPSQQPAQTPGKILYVSPDGDDGRAGGIDAPLATLQGARDRIRTIKASSGLPAGGITVYLRGGSYYLDDMATFGEEDSGTVGSPITYAAYPGETPVLTGGRYFSGSQLERPSGALAERLPASARDSLYAIKLFENGFTPDDLDSLEDWQSGEFGSIKMAVYVDDQAMHLARYPNKVPGNYAENSYHDYLYVEDGGGWIAGGDYGQATYPVFQVSPAVAQRMAGWAGYGEVLVSGMMSYTWVNENNLIRSYDATTRAIELGRNHRTPYDGAREPFLGRYYFQNVVEELDAPGEYFIDRETGTLLFYAPAGYSRGEHSVKIPKLDTENIIDCDGASYLAFSGLTMELAKGNGMHIWRGSNVTVDGCTIKNVSKTGVWLGYTVYEGSTLAEYYGGHGAFPEDEPSAELNGRDYTVKNCAIANTGVVGAILAGGKASSREGGNLLFENNTVLHTGYIFNAGGVDANGVGVRVLRNTIAFAPGMGMVINGPDCEAAFNELYDVVCDPAQNDSSAFGIHHGSLAWGTKVHDNYIHHVPRTPVRDWETWMDEGTPNRLALYVDGCGPGAQIYRNVIYDVPIGMCMPDNPTFPSTYANNVFVDAMMPVQSYQLADLDDLRNYSFEQLVTLPTGNGANFFYETGLYKALWKEVYPEFFDFYEYYLNKKEDITQPMSPVYNNLCVNIAIPRVAVDPKGPWGPMPPDGEVTPDPVYGRYGNNRYLDADPGFVDYAAGDIQLTKEAAAELGIEWIDLSLIGARGTLDPPSPATDTYTVAFDVRGGTPVAAIEVEAGQSIALAPTSSKEGFLLGGWRLGQADGPQVDFPFIPAGDVTLYADWIPQSSPSQPTQPPDSPQPPTPTQPSDPPQPGVTQPGVTQPAADPQPSGILAAAGDAPMLYFFPAVTLLGATLVCAALLIAGRARRKRQGAAE